MIYQLSSYETFLICRCLLHINNTRIPATETEVLVFFQMTSRGTKSSVFFFPISPQEHFVKKDYSIGSGRIFHGSPNIGKGIIVCREKKYGFLNLFHKQKK